jgi:adenylylsulfate kinase
MGLSGSGKTTLASRLSTSLRCPHLNADKVRKECNDWDFSLEGRERQMYRLKEEARILSKYSNVVVDFICPTNRLQELFGADYTIWMDTVSSSKYYDTDKVFQKPNKYNHRIKGWGENVVEKILEGLK